MTAAVYAAVLTPIAVLAPIKEAERGLLSRGDRKFDTPAVVAQASVIWMDSIFGGVVG